MKNEPISLPDYVFDRSYEQYLFIWGDNFYIPSQCRKIIEIYCSILLDCNESTFSVFDVPSMESGLVLLKKILIDSDTPNEVVNNLLQGTYNNIKNYFTSMCFNAYLISDKNNMCIYWERDMEAMVIGCTKEIALKFKKRSGDLIMNLGEYIILMEHYFPTMPLLIKERLLINYGYTKPKN